MWFALWASLQNYPHVKGTINCKWRFFGRFDVLSVTRHCHREINHQSVYSIKPRKRNTRCNFNKQLWKRTLRPVLARLRLEITATQKMMRVWLKQKCTTGNQPTWSVATGRDTGRYLLETNLKSGLVSNRYLPDQYGLCVLLRHAICLSPYIPTWGTCLLF